MSLEGYSQGAFSSLRDGAFLYAADGKFRRLFAGGRPKDVAGTVDDVYAVLPYERLDRVWIVRQDGNVELAVLASGTRKLWGAETGGTPFAAASAGRSLAVLWLYQQKNAPKRFQLDVFDDKGAAHFRESFEAEYPATEDWVQHLQRNTNLALSEDLSLVFVGGPDRLRAWDVNTKKLLLDVH